jgi:hypothetical protein
MTENLLNLNIGSELKLDSISDVALNNLHSELIGYTHGESLIISHPQKDSLPIQINPGEKFMIGAQQGGDDISFETKVTAVLSEPYPHLHTTYPVNIRSGSIRQSSRVDAAPAQIRLVNEDGTVDSTQLSFLNVSTSGACLVADKKLGEVNDIFEIDFHQGDDESNPTFTCMIRYVHKTHKNDHAVFNHGVVFIGMDAETQLLLWRYFQESAALQSGQVISAC